MSVRGGKGKIFVILVWEGSRFIHEHHTGWQKKRKGTLLFAILLTTKQKRSQKESAEF